MSGGQTSTIHFIDIFEKLFDSLYGGKILDLIVHVIDQSLMVMAYRFVCIRRAFSLKFQCYMVGEHIFL
jgi:hypothetical protein